jgi:hypothetical protein
LLQQVRASPIPNRIERALRDAAKPSFQTLGNVLGSFAATLNQVLGSSAQSVEVGPNQIQARRVVAVAPQTKFAFFGADCLPIARG